MISVTHAKHVLQQNCSRGLISEFGLEECLDLIVAEDIHSPMAVPNFDNSAMDGYAMKFDDHRESWTLTGTVQAGDTSDHHIRTGEAVRIFTGARIPTGADTVIQQELVEMDKIDNKVMYKGDRIRAGSNVRLRGSQCEKGSKILRMGTRISPGTIALLASVGVGRIRCYSPPTVAVIVTGNELKEVGEELSPGEIYNSNGPMLTALLQQDRSGDFEVHRVKDDREILQRIINQALDEKDLLILSGGISVGDYDFVKECLEQAGVEELFYKIKQRPGKPMYAGTRNKKLIFALPGNPGSVHSCYVQYVRPCLRTILGEAQPWEPDSLLPLDAEVKKRSGLTFFMKGRKKNDEVQLLAGQQSFNLSAFSEADCLVELPEENDLVEQGEVVKVYDL